jgi:hypothetical protein
MFNVANDNQERIQCLKQILRINPNNQKANELLNHHELESLKVGPARSQRNVSFYQTDKAPKNKKTSTAILLFVGIIGMALLFCGCVILSFIFSNPSDSPSSQGVIVNTGIKRSAIQSVFEGRFGFLFDRVPENRGGQPSLGAKSADGLTGIELYGPADDLISAGIWIAIYDNATSSELSLIREYFITFLKSAIPDWSDSENWFDSNYPSGWADKNYGNLKISLSEIDTSDGRMLMLSIERIDRVK